MKVLSFILLFTLTLLNFTDLVNCKHTEILSIRDFNQIINSLPCYSIDNNTIQKDITASRSIYDNYTSFNVIKYYTTWCSHCKKLAPVWSKLTKSFPNINFLSIDCDVFGKSLCRDLPGYPIIKIITTKRSDIDVNMDLSHDANNNSNNMSWFAYLKSWFMHGDPYNTEMIDIISSKRVIEYKGRRDYESLYNFIDSLIQLHQLETQFNRIVYENDSTLDSDLLNSYFTQTLLGNHIVSVVTVTHADDNNSVKVQVSDISSLDKERHKLQNIIRNNPNTTESNGIRVKLQFLNWLEDQVETANDNNNDDDDTSATTDTLSNIKDEL